MALQRRHLPPRPRPPASTGEGCRKLQLLWEFLSLFRRVGICKGQCRRDRGVHPLFVQRVPSTVRRRPGKATDGRTQLYCLVLAEEAHLSCNARPQHWRQRSLKTPGPTADTSTDRRNIGRNMGTTQPAYQSTVQRASVAQLASPAVTIAVGGRKLRGCQTHDYCCWTVSSIPIQNFLVGFTIASPTDTPFLLYPISFLSLSHQCPAGRSRCLAPLPFSSMRDGGMGRSRRLNPKP